MFIKHLIFPLACLALTFPASTLAKKPEVKGSPQSNGSETHWINSNKQSAESSTRGKERAGKRHELKRQKDHKKKFKAKKQKYQGKFHDRRDDNDEGRYRRQYEEERYGMDPLDDRKYQEHKKQREHHEQRYENDRYLQHSIDSIIDRNVEKAKSKINEMHGRTIDVINDKSR